MKKLRIIGFIIVFLAPMSLGFCSQKIEVFTGNKHFSSFEKYKQYRQSTLKESTGAFRDEGSQTPEWIAFNSFISQHKNPEEFSFDQQKVKTIVPSIPRATQEQLKQVDFKAPVKQNVEEFVQNPTQPKAQSFNVLQEDLEGLLQTTAVSDDPQLYLMNQERLRIMSLSSEDKSN